MVTSILRQVNNAIWRCRLFFVVVTLCCGRFVSAAPQDEVTKRGFQHTNLDTELVAKSIFRANETLEGTDIRLVPSWSMKSTTGANAGAVPVYLVKGPQDTATTPAAVPEGCRCIFVNPAFLASWIEFNSRGDGRMKLDRGYFLTFVLLHEAGHIKQGTPAAAFKDGEMTQLNIDPAIAKKNERLADEFAAMLLKKLSRQSRATMASIDANFVVNELVKLSWNMQAFRTLDEFGSFAVGKPSVFFDLDYTHPNMALRILRTNDLILESDATRSLLKAFEEARERGANPQPLFQRK